MNRDARAATPSRAPRGLRRRLDTPRRHRRRPHPRLERQSRTRRRRAPPPSTATTPSWAPWANGSSSTGYPKSTPTYKPARALGHAGRERQMRDELSAAVPTPARARSQHTTATRRQTRTTGSSASPPSSSEPDPQSNATATAAKSSSSPAPKHPPGSSSSSTGCSPASTSIGATRTDAWNVVTKVRARQRPRPPTRRPLLPRRRTKGHQPGSKRRPAPLLNHPPSPRRPHRTRPRRARTTRGREGPPMVTQRLHNCPFAGISRNVRSNRDRSRNVRG